MVKEEKHKNKKKPHVIRIPDVIKIIFYYYSVLDDRVMGCHVTAEVHVDEPPD